MAKDIDDRVPYMRLYLGGENNTWVVADRGGWIDGEWPTLLGAILATGTSLIHPLDPRQLPDGERALTMQLNSLAEEHGRMKVQVHELTQENNRLRYLLTCVSPHHPLGA